MSTIRGLFRKKWDSKELWCTMKGSLKPEETAPGKEIVIEEEKTSC